MALYFTSLPVVGSQKIGNIIGGLLSKAMHFLLLSFLFLFSFLHSCICSVHFNNLSFSPFPSLFICPLFVFHFNLSPSPYLHIFPFLFPGVCWGTSVHAVLCHEAANGKGTNRRNHRRGPLLPQRGQTHQTADRLQDFGQYTHVLVDTDSWTTYLVLDEHVKQIHIHREYINTDLMCPVFSESLSYLLKTKSKLLNQCSF